MTELKPVQAEFTAVEAASVVGGNPDRFVNREFSWLQFNRRVLEESQNPNHPLLERVRFLSISADNLDEFFMVRVAGLAGQVRQGIKLKSPDGRTPEQQLEQLLREVERLQEDQQKSLSGLMLLLDREGIASVTGEQLGKDERTWLEGHFQDQIFPVLTPLSIDPAHPFPFIPNLGFSIALQLRHRKDGQTMSALLRLPPALKRFVRLPDRKDKVRFVPLEEVVGLYIGKLFPGYEVNGSGTFRIADDFTVPAGKSWTITKLSTFCYQSPGSPTTFPSTQTMTLRIWNGRPDLPTSSVVFGDATTPLTPTAVFTNIYRCFNTAPLGQIPGTTRPIWRMDLPLNLTLPAGTYWADWNNSTATFSPQLAMMTNASNGVRDASNPNAMQFVLSNPPNVGGIWQLIGEGGAASGCLAANYDMPFILEGAENSTGSPCYANCDGSTQQPCLNVLDFGCFLNKFSSGDTYANCDNSTQSPILNVLDFGCFLNKFAAGCSAC